MGLDIYVKANPSPSKYPDTFWTSFNNDFENGGDYFFLLPLIETLYKQTGQCLDLYGNALFCGDDLKTFVDFVAAAERLVDSQPETWSVHIGTQTEPVAKEFYANCHKAKFQVMLKKLAEIIAKAQELNGCVICVGD